MISGAEQPDELIHYVVVVFFLSAMEIRLYNSFSVIELAQIWIDVLWLNLIPFI